MDKKSLCHSARDCKYHVVWISDSKFKKDKLDWRDGTRHFKGTVERF
jgi:hypothetical protein